MFRIQAFTTVLVVLCLFLAGTQAEAQTQYNLVTDIAYHGDQPPSAYAAARCRLDLYHPTGSLTGNKDYATVVWFHGGGLKNGKRYVPEGLKEKGIAVVAVNYRLSSQAKALAYLVDAAAAVAWTLKNIQQYGGDRNKVVVSGHSAGGYQAAMLALDHRWLAAYDFKPTDVAGFVPYSAQTMTHRTIRTERGLKASTPLVDDLAPLHHLTKQTPPMLLVTGDRRLESPGRYEQNALLCALLTSAKHPDVKLYELQGFNHNTMREPAHPLLLQFIRRVTSE